MTTEVTRDGNTFTIAVTIRRENAIHLTPEDMDSVQASSLNGTSGRIHALKLLRSNYDLSLGTALQVLDLIAPRPE